MKSSRRRLLRVGAVAAAGALAGCISGGGSGSDDGSDAGPTGSGSSGAAGGDGEGTTTTTNGGETTESVDRLRLPTLDVGGSPGGEVVVKPPDTVTLLDFFATWCAPCKPQMDHLGEIHDRFPDVHLLSITNERDEGAIRSFWREYDGTWPVAQDTDLTATSRYSATQMPTMIVLDAEGSEVWRHVGLSAADSIAEQLRAAGATEQ